MLLTAPAPELFHKSRAIRMQNKWGSHLSRKQGRETAVNEVTFFLDLSVIL